MWQNESTDALLQPKGIGTAWDNIPIMQYVAQGLRRASKSRNCAETSKWQCKWQVSWDIDYLVLVKRHADMVAPRCWT